MHCATASSVTLGSRVPPSVPQRELDQPCLSVWSLLMWTFQDFRGQTGHSGRVDTAPSVPPDSCGAFPGSASEARRARDCRCALPAVGLGGDEVKSIACTRTSGEAGMEGHATKVFCSYSVAD